MTSWSWLGFCLMYLQFTGSGHEQALKQRQKHTRKPFAHIWARFGPILPGCSHCEHPRISEAITDASDPPGPHLLPSLPHTDRQHARIFPLGESWLL